MFGFNISHTIIYTFQKHLLVKNIFNFVTLNRYIAKNIIHEEWL